MILTLGMVCVTARTVFGKRILGKNFLATTAMLLSDQRNDSTGAAVNLGSNIPNRIALATMVCGSLIPSFTMLAAMLTRNIKDNIAIVTVLMGCRIPSL